MDHSILQERVEDAQGDASPESVKARHAVAAAAKIRAVSFDNLSDVRFLHAQALKNLATGEFSDEEFAVGRAHIYSQKYVEALGAAVARHQFFGTWIGDALVGTVGWSMMDDSVGVARIRSIFVSPLYTRMGLAGQLLAHVEGEAISAGFRTFSVRSMTNATGFFVRQGYVVTSHGARSLLPNRTVPVTFLRKTVA
jgi:GNAT superfamily N-acetyltransferase